MLSLKNEICPIANNTKLYLIGSGHNGHEQIVMNEKGNIFGRFEEFYYEKGLSLDDFIRVVCKDAMEH